MSNALPLQDFIPSTSQPERPNEKPKLTLVPPAEDSVDLKSLAAMFRTQNRECWICRKIVAQIDGGRNLSDEDKWHLTACVTSWENLPE